MSKIYDYLAFSHSKSQSSPGAFNFEVELKYVDIDISGRPEEYDDITDSKVYLEYSAELFFKKAGIDSVMLKVNSIELEFEVDDYPNLPKQFDVDLIPGKTIDFSQIKTEDGENIIPTYPSKIEIDMGKSTDPKKWEISVSFGSNRY
jgi:hypothetical protein